MSNPFFDEMSDKSEVKSQIVADYFGAWTTIMASKSRSDKLIDINSVLHVGIINPSVNDLCHIY